MCSKSHLEGREAGLVEAGCERPRCLIRTVPQKELGEMGHANPFHGSNLRHSSGARDSLWAGDEPTLLVHIHGV